MLSRIPVPTASSMEAPPAACLQPSSQSNTLKPAQATAPGSMSARQSQCPRQNSTSLNASSRPSPKGSLVYSTSRKWQVKNERSLRAGPCWLSGTRKGGLTEGGLHSPRARELQASRAIVPTTSRTASRVVALLGSQWGKRTRRMRRRTGLGSGCATAPAKSAAKGGAYIRYLGNNMIETIRSSRFQEEDSRLQQELVQCRAELNLLRKKCKEKDALLRELGDRLAASEASVQAFRDLQAREDGDRAAETKRHSESRLKEQLHSMKTLYERERKGREELVSNLKGENVRLRQLLITLQNQKACLQSEADLADSQLQQMRAKIALLESQLASKGEEVHSLGLTLAQLQRRLGEEQRSQTQLRNELDRAQTQLRADELERRKQSQASAQDAQSWHKREAGLKVQLQSLQQELKLQSQANQMLQRQLASRTIGLRLNQEKLQDELEGKRKAVSLLETQVERLEGQVRHLVGQRDRRAEQVLALESDRQELGLRLQEQSQARLKLKQQSQREVAAHRRENSERQKLVSELKCLVESLEGRVKAKDEEVRSCSLSREELLRQVQQERKLVHELRLTVAEQEHRKSLLLLDLGARGDEAQELRVRLEETRERVQFAEREVLSVRDQVEYERTRNQHLEQLYGRYRLTRAKGSLEQTRVRQN